MGLEPKNTDSPPTALTSLIHIAADNLRSGQIERGTKQLKNIVDRAPDCALAVSELGRALLITGALDDAATYLSRALILDPTTPGLALSYARCRYFDNRKIPQLEILEALTENKTLEPIIQADLHFALGKIYDDLADYDKAFTFFTRANSIMEKFTNYNNAKVHQSVKILKTAFTNTFLKSIQKPPLRNCSPIFIVGMPRSGTTLVEQILASHLDVTAAGELSYLQDMSIEYSKKIGITYPKSVRRMTPEDIKQMAFSYCAKINNTLGECARFTDKMPTNFFHLGLISVLFPEAAIVHCYRNPADIALSNYFQQFESGNDWSYKLTDIINFYGHYLNIMAHWMDVLPKKIFTVDYEDLVNDPDGSRQRLFDYCRLSAAGTIRQFHEIERPVMTSSNWQVRQPIYKHATGRWRNYESQIGSQLETLIHLDRPQFLFRKSL